jgi:alkanesulfonate monooxygenase SsuD/methylene tetrahydromethanopterin reductase-like flavin-dependent oxidoreductase (luciferase family)
MRLKTSVLLLPILNAVEVAESVATLDHICHGRLDVGVAIGYRELELAAAGLARADRVAKLTESIDLMKRLWRGESVTLKARDGRAESGRLGFTPLQQPHPPLEMGAQSEGAARRAARLTDGVFFGPQLGWADVGRFGAMFREARVASGAATPGYVGASRSLIVGASKEAAAAGARAYLEKTFTMYRTWRMQEPAMGRLQLGFETSLDEWTIHGSPGDCVETIERARSLGVERLGFTIYSLPTDVRARIDYLQMIADDIVTPAQRRTS